MRFGILTGLLCGVMFAQGADPALSFEVASVKPAVPDSNGRLLSAIRGGPGTSDPEQFTYTGVTLKALFLMAYNVKNYQATAPAWLDTERYDVVAKIPPGATKEQFNRMLQNLLAERFHLAMHRETKGLSAYELVIAKNGSKLKETTMDPNAPAPAGARGPLKMDANGFPQLDRAGLMRLMVYINNVLEARLVAKAQPLSALLQLLEGQLKGPIVDKTGLTGKYDFTLEYSPDTTVVLPLPAAGPPGDAAGGTPPEIASGPSLGAALQDQLGLKLEQKKVLLEMLVIDRADKTPAEN